MNNSMNSRRPFSKALKVRRGSALILVLIMTLSLAGLAMSAIYLSSSAGLLSRYYDRERNYRYAAEAAIALGKSRLQVGDTTLKLPDDSAKVLLTAASLTDANGITIPRVLVNLYGGYTGDTVGIFGKFATLLAQAYDSGGTRMVRRLDLTAESFSRFAMFTNTFSGGLAYGPGEFIRGRSHSNQGWNSSGSPGPTYFDTVSAHTTLSGTPTYYVPPIAGAALIPMPTIAKLASLTTYASNAGLQFTPVTATSASNAVSQTNYLSVGTVNLSGEMVAGVKPTQGTRVSFKPVDVNNNGLLDLGEGMMMIFDLAVGMDTSTLRVDLPRSGTTPNNNIVMLNQCGVLMTFPAGQIPAGTGPTFTTAHNEFFPLARIHEAWVRKRMYAGTLVTGGSIAPADTFVMASDTTIGTTASPMAGDSLPSAKAINKIMSYGVGNSRCFPAGSPLLMLTERHVNASCVIDSTTTTGTSLWGWGAPTPCGATPAKQYGGMDTTFTANVTRCAFFGGGAHTGTPGTGAGAGKCPTTGTTGQVKLGSWRPWTGTALPAIASSVIQATEKGFLWPLWIPYNMNSKGVVNATTGPVYLSDTLRAYLTFYESNASQNIVIIDDLVYDQDPTISTALCRNFLGIIAGQHVLAADNGLNRPRPDASGTIRWFGFPNFTLHAVTLALNGTVGLEDGYNYPTTSPSGPATSPATVCGVSTNTTSGGCINQTGGVIEQFISPTFLSSGNTGMRENRTVDPCQRTNQRPPFFPATGRYLDNKYYEIDPTLVATWAQVKTFFGTLRGHTAP
jgi:hypothetical protein